MATVSSIAAIVFFIVIAPCWRAAGAFAASSLVERSRVAVFDSRRLSDRLRLKRRENQASSHHFVFGGFQISLLRTDVAIVAEAAARKMRAVQTTPHLHTVHNEFLVTHVADMRVSDGSAAAQAYA
jgi:hypothetical protein